jgi:hypothetical protein
MRRPAKLKLRESERQGRRFVALAPKKGGRGGARPGGGRPRLRLAQVVERRRFDWRLPTHRRALLEDELTDELLAELAARGDMTVDGVRTLVEGYRRQASWSPSSASWLAQRFARVVEGDPDARQQREEANARLRVQARGRRGNA